MSAGIVIYDPQLVWRGKDSQDWSDLVVNAPLSPSLPQVVRGSALISLGHR